MKKKYFILILLTSLQYLYSDDKSEILFAMDKYNKAFILADYDEIIENFIFPVSIITSEKIFSIDTKWGLKFVYKKTRGDLPEFYSYSKWNDIDINNLPIFEPGLAEIVERCRGKIFISPPTLMKELENQIWFLYQLILQQRNMDLELVRLVI